MKVRHKRILSLAYFQTSGDFCTSFYLFFCYFSFFFSSRPERVYRKAFAYMQRPLASSYSWPRARIFKPLRSPRIDPKKLIPPPFVAWRAGTSNRVVVTARQAGNRFLGFLKGLQIRAQDRDLPVENTSIVTPPSMGPQLRAPGRHPLIPGGI